jgi:hypothetical protein
MKIIKIIAQFYYLICFLIINVRRTINFKWAVFQANNTYKLKGKQVWVLQSDSVHYVNFTNEMIKLTNKYSKSSMLTGKQLNIIELNKLAVYKTNPSTLNKRNI